MNNLRENIPIRVRLFIKSFILLVVIVFGCLDIYSRAQDIDDGVKKIDEAYARVVETDSFYDTAEDIIFVYMRSFGDFSLTPNQKIDGLLNSLKNAVGNQSILSEKTTNSIMTDINNAQSSLKKAYYYAERGKIKEARQHSYNSYLSVSLIHDTLKGIDDEEDDNFQNLRKDVRAKIVGSPSQQLFVLMGCLFFVLVLGISMIIDILVPLKGVSERMVLASKDPANAKKYIERKVRLDELGIVQLALSNLLIEIEQNIKRSLNAEALARQRLAAIEASQDGIGIVDKEGMLTYANRSLFNIHGISEREVGHYIGNSWKNLYPEEGQKAIDLKVFPEINRRGFWRGEAPVVRKDGSLVIAEMSVTRLADGGLIGTARDISERVKATADNEKMLRQMLDAQKLEAVGRLTGGIAHDFNNMLTIINGNLDMAVDFSSPDSEGAKYIKIAKRAVLRGSELTQRLLAFSRNQTLNPKVLNLNVIIPETTMMIIRAIGEKIEIIFDLAEALSPVKIDVGQFENALINLAINARDAMPDGGYIKIKTLNRTLAEDDIIHQGKILPGNYVMVEISDTGCGIPDDLKNRIFDPFFTTKDVGEGSGLGLSMVYGFVKQSNGHIVVDSKVGIGTSVKLFFPVQDSAEINVQTGDTLEEDFLLDKDFSGHESILIVEDEDEILKLNHDILQGLGYTIHCATNAEDAISLVKSVDHIDLLITDIIMPGKMNGYDLAKEVKGLMPGIKTLFISGYAPTQLLEMENAPSNIDLLSKPYLKEHFIKRVRSKLDSILH